jgi:hypothetical protein
MGNSDSKPVKGTSTISLTSEQADRNRIHSFLELEFERRADRETKYLSRDGFQQCLKAVQDQYELRNISGSPLGIGLFEISAKERSQGKAVMSVSEYASAMAVLFNSIDASTLASLTSQAVLKWFQTFRGLPSPPSVVSDEIMICFVESSWRFAWAELSNRILSNVCLNGKSEMEAIERFSESHAKFFSAHIRELNLTLVPPVDRTIHVSVGDEEILVPTSFSFVSKQKPPRYDDLRTRATRSGPSAYPEI